MPEFVAFTESGIYCRQKDKKIALFDGQQIRRHWDEKQEKWYFSVVDVVGVLSSSVDSRNYWKVLKNR